MLFSDKKAMNDELERLLLLPEEDVEEDWLDLACRKNREECNNLSDENRQDLMDVAMSIVYD